MIRGITAVFITLCMTAPAIADRLVRISDVTRGEVKDISSAVLGVDAGGFYAPGRRFVLALRDAADQLRLMAWQVSDSGTLSLTSNTATGEVRRVSIAWIGGRRVVTAMRDAAGLLRAITWQLSSNGTTFSRLGTRTLDRIQDVEVAGEAMYIGLTRSRQRFLTASRDQQSNLQVASWFVQSNGQITAPAHVTYGKVGRIHAITGQGDFATAITVQDANNQLLLMSFQLPGSIIVDRGGNGRGGKIQLVSNTGFTLDNDLYTATTSEGPTGIRTPPFNVGRILTLSGVLKVIRWKKEKSGGREFLRSNFERKEEHEFGGTAGLAVEVDIKSVAKASGVDGGIVTAHLGVSSFNSWRREKRGKPRLQVTAFTDATHSQGPLKPTAHAHVGGTFADVQIVPLAPTERGIAFVTVLRQGDGKLRLISWELRE